MDYKARRIEDDENLINKIVATRHYLTHYDKSLQKKVATGLELLRLTQILQLIVRIFLLKETGFEPEHIRTLLIRANESNLRTDSPLKAILG